MTSLINWLSQISSVTRVSIQTIPERTGSSFASAFGIAGVVAVLVGVLSIAQGFRKTMTVSGSPDTAVVLRSGADTEMTSSLTGEETRIIADTEGIARSADGVMASSELFVIINLLKRSTKTDANVPLRGVQSAAFEVRDGLKIIEGRRFEEGRNEIVVGVGAAAEFEGLDLDATIEVGPNKWEVVGIFTCNGGIAESEIWTDAAVLQPAYQRVNMFQSTYAKLSSPDAYAGFTNSLVNNPQLKVKVLRETEFYAEQSTMVTGLISSLGWIVAVAMAIGAVFGALLTMYSAVSARTREIATLRALGFGASPVVISVLIESIVLALVGGSIGSIGAYIAFDEFRAATINWQTFSQVTFAFDVSPGLLIKGIICATVIGLIGGLFPAIRAARLPIATALRDL